MLRIVSRAWGSISPPETSRIDPWNVQRRFMGGAKKSMAKARKNFAKKEKKEARVRYLAKREVIPALDKELRKHTKMRMVWNVKLILASRNGRVVPSTEFGRLSRELGFPQAKMFPEFIRQFPGIFKLTADRQERHVRWLEFSDKADMLVDEEEKVMQEYHEHLIVTNLRKLLMMVPARKLLLNKLAHIRPSFWMPDDFRTSILPKYPEYFNITGGYLELVADDKSLAVSARERTQQGKVDLGYRPNKFNKERSGESSVYAFRVTFERHKILDNNIAARMIAFQTLPFPGPYDPIGDLDARTVQAQKRVVGVCHEFLSFTVEKRAYIDNLSFFRKELLLPDKLEDMLARFPHIFYVCMRGDRHVVFLKEYYQNGKLVDKHPLVNIKEQFAKLMDYTTSPRKPAQPIKVKGIVAEEFVTRRHAAPVSVDAQGVPAAPVSVDAQVFSPASVSQAFPPAPVPVDAHGSLPSPLPGGPRPTSAPPPVRHRQPVLPVRQPEPLPGEQGGGLFLQLGFSDDDDEDDRQRKTMALAGVKRLSLGQKLGILNDDDSEDERKPTRGKVDIWGGWKKDEEEDAGEEELVRRRKKRNKKPFWDKRPFDNFDDPFF